MGLRKFIEFEARRVTSRRYIAIVFVFLVASGYFIYHGISQYKHILEEKNNFLEFEREKYEYFIYPSKHGNYGIRLMFVPSPMMVFFDGGPVPNYMITFIDGSERLFIYQPLKGQSAFSRITSAFMTFAGFILLFGSGLALLYGFAGSKDHEWLKFLEELVGERKKLFLYQLIARAFILLLFCLVMDVFSIILFIISGIPLNFGCFLIFTLAIFFMLFFFLFGGLIAGTLKSRFWGWVSMVIAWFLLAFLVPAILYHFTYGLAGSIRSPYKMDTVKLKLFQDYEKGSLEKGGKFDQSKRGSELEKDMFILFWNGGFKELMGHEADMVNEMKDIASFFQTLASFFPSTSFLSVSSELSSRGFANLMGFNEYSQEMKMSYIWYLAKNYLLSKKTVFPPFIKKDENLYQGQSQLPSNFGFGLVVTVLWLAVLFVFSWLGFNRMLDRARDTERELSPDELNKDKTNVIFTSDKGLLPQLITKLRSQNIPFLSVPGPASLPGDVKVKNLFSLFGTAVPGVLKEIAGKYVFTLEPDQKGKVLSEITRSLTADVLIFDNFLAGLSDDIIYYFADVLNSIKKGRTVVYFTNSLLVSSVIADCGIKWTDEKIAF